MNGLRRVNLFRNRRFVQLYAAGLASDLGDALHYIALMWFALELGGPLGVMTVRLADSVPALVFGLYGGVAADRFPRKALLVGADLVRAAVLLPLAYAALTHQLGIVQLACSAFLLETASSLFAPAHGALLPSVVGHGAIQRANAIIRASHHGVSIGGWAAAAAMLAVMPMGIFFALNAVSFLLSALFLVGMASAPQPTHSTPPRIAKGLQALGERPLLALAIGTLGVAGAIGSGSWIAGLPKLIRSDLHSGASGFSLTMAAYAVGALAAGVLLARIPIARKLRASVLFWALELPGFLLIASATRLRHAMFGALIIGVATAAARLLLSSAAQEQSPPKTLGRVMGMIALVDRGSRALGLLLIAPFYGFLPERPLLAATGVLIAATSLAAIGLSRARWAQVAGPPASDEKDELPAGSAPESAPPSLRDRD
jgi:MFS transporter, DHA3 family, macrolide efflux protein